MALFESCLQIATNRIARASRRPLRTLRAEAVLRSSLRVVVTGFGS
jgi:hypothetical protein